METPNTFPSPTEIPNTLQWNYHLCEVPNPHPRSRAQREYKRLTVGRINFSKPGYVSIFVCVGACMRAECLHVCLYVDIYAAYVHVCMFVCMYGCTTIYVRVCACVYTMCVCMYKTGLFLAGLSSTSLLTCSDSARFRGVEHLCACACTR